jgi:hypothetical protein
MRPLRTLILLVTAGFAASAATAQAQPPGTLWTDGKVSVEVVPCGPHGDYDASCRGIGLRHAGKLHPIGEGYMSVDLVWQRGQGAAGPDLVVRGNSGGSAGIADIFALDLAHGIVRKLNLNRGDTVAASQGPGPLRLEVPFVVGYFNGAPHSQDSVVPVPFLWADGDLRLDFNALAGRAFAVSDLRFRELAIREELSHRVQDVSPEIALYHLGGVSPQGGTPVTVYALLDLMLAGRADEARALLHRVWPWRSDGHGTPYAGEDAFWTGLCRAVSQREDWRKYGFDRLPHAELIEAAARAPTGATR